MELKVEKLEYAGYVRVRKGKDVLIISRDWEVDKEVHKKIHDQIKAS